MVDRYVSLLSRCVRAVLADVSAGVGIIAALSLPVVLGSAGLAVDLNHGLEQRVINQRAADMAALGAAMAYKASSDAKDSNPERVLDPTAQDIARVNGLRDAEIQATIVHDFPNAGDQSVRVNIVTEVPYTLAKVLGLSGSYDVTSQSFASLTKAVTVPPFATPCILALSSSSSAIMVSGGASIKAADCTVAAVGSITNNGQEIQGHDIVSGEGDITNNYGALTAEQLRYGGSFNNPSWNAAVPSEDKRKDIATTLIDPWAGNSELADARDLLGHYDPVPTNPPSSSCSGAVNWSLDWSPGAGHPAKAYWTGSGYAMPAGTYCIKKMTTGGGLSITFASGSNIYVQQGITIGGGTTVNLGASNLYVKGGGISISGGSELAMSAGNVAIDAGISKAIDLSGSARFFMGNGTFSANGDINTQGGSALVFGKTANHYINGNMTIAGSALFGAGRYTISGNFNNGTGGTTWPYTSSVNGKTYGQTLEGESVSGFDMAGVDVTFILGGTLNLGGGAKTKLIAPETSVTGAQIADMLLYSETSSNTNWYAGANNRFGGAIYLPNSAVTMSGGNSTLDAGHCFTLVADTINVSGGAATGSICATVEEAYNGDTGGSASSGAIRLVQ